MSQFLHAGFVQLPSPPPSQALERLEQLLETILEAISRGEEIIIPYRTARSQDHSLSLPLPEDVRDLGGVRFPGRTPMEAKRFEALFCIITMAHEALLSGNVITKRNVYYQNPQLFKSQAVVDDMVDNLAFTLGVGREDLNIVAAAKGLMYGPFEVTLVDGSIQTCDAPGDSGILIPPSASLRAVDFRDTGWLLVIEKEATFRTLAASQYAAYSQAGPGILLTAKGYPDLATRRFLSVLSYLRPNLVIAALVDFDPDGLSIMRTYKHGSRRLDHEQGVTVPELRWLGICSNDLLIVNPVPCHGEMGSLSLSENQSGSQGSQTWSADGSQSERPTKRAKIQSSSQPWDSILPLTQRDRKRAISLMKDITSSHQLTEEDEHQLRELQRMLILNIKAEIQAVDHYGDMAAWLDVKMTKCMTERNNSII